MESKMESKMEWNIESDRESIIETEICISYIQKVLVLAFGNMVAALGVSLCAFAGMGVDPLTVLFQGVSNKTGLEIGTAALCVNIALLLICAIMDRKSIKPGTIISMCTFSIFLNFFINYTGMVLTDGTPVFLWIYLMIGIVLMGLGVALGAHFWIGTVLCVLLVGVIYTWNMGVLQRIKR